jgi:hypothetical protein
LLQGGDWLLGSVVAVTLTKLALRTATLYGRDSREAKAAAVDAMLVQLAILELGMGMGGGSATAAASAAGAAVAALAGGSASASASASVPRLDQDSFERVAQCLRLLGDPAAAAAGADALLGEARAAFQNLLAYHAAQEAAAEAGVSGAELEALLAQAGGGGGGGGGGAESESKGESKGEGKGDAWDATAARIAALLQRTGGGAGAGGGDGAAGAAATAAATAAAVFGEGGGGIGARVGAQEGGDAGAGAGRSGRVALLTRARTSTSPTVVAGADAALSLRQLRGRTAAGGADEGGLLDDEEGSALGEAGALALGVTPAGAGAAASGGSGARRGGGDAALDEFAARLRRVQPLTGFGDPLYVEACVTVREYDISVDLLLLNRTGTTFTGVTVDMGTVGDLRVTDRPAPFTLAPRDVSRCTVHIKVSATESGHVFGSVSYTASDAPAETQMVHLAEIALDVMEYIRPAYCDPATFRQMWAEFEWENKVAVATHITNLQELVAHVARITHMRVLTPTRALEGSANFLAANLYARSIFGEDALMNISIENKPDGSIRGHIRIRAKTQGVALSLGDRINAKQRAV